MRASVVASVPADQFDQPASFPAAISISMVVSGGSTTSIHASVACSASSSHAASIPTSRQRSRYFVAVATMAPVAVMVVAVIALATGGAGTAGRTRRGTTRAERENCDHSVPAFPAATWTSY